MIRLLILVMAGAIALALAYFFFKSIPMAKKILAVGGGLAAAMAAVALQGNDSFYTPFLAIIGIALLATLIYMKIVEKQQVKKQRHAEEKKTRQVAELSQNNAAESRFSMSPVETGKGEQ